MPSDNKEVSWEERFRRKFCEYVIGAPGSFRFKKEISEASVEIFIQCLLASETAAREKEIINFILADIKNQRDKGYESQTIIEHLDNHYILEGIIKNSVSK